MNRRKEFENQDNNTDHNEKETKQEREEYRVVEKRIEEPSSSSDF
jgi:hypothetical protein